jgi:hypothetical protein
MYYRSVVYRNVMRSVHKYLLFFLVLSVTPAYSQYTSLDAELDEIRLLRELTGKAPLLTVDVTRSVPGEFFVIFDDHVPTTRVQQVADSLSLTHNAEVQAVFDYAVNGFWARLESEVIEIVQAIPEVLYIEPITIFEFSQVPWGKDRMNQRDLPLDGNSNFNRFARNISIHVIDSGVNHHSELDNVQLVRYDYTGEGREDDCYDHGTGVASIIAGTTPSRWSPLTCRTSRSRSSFS